MGDGRVPVPAIIEFLAGNSPVSPWLSTARVAFDPRKDPLNRAANVLTGFRMSDVSPAAQAAVLRDAAAGLAKDIGAKSFTRILFTKDQIAELDRINPSAAERARAFNALQRQLSNRQKNRKKAKEKEST